VFSKFQNPELSSFNNIFSTPGERGERLSEAATSEIMRRMEAARSRATPPMAAQRNEEEGTVVVTPTPTGTAVGQTQAMHNTHVEQQSQSGGKMAGGQHATDDSLLQLQTREEEKVAQRCVEEMDFEYNQSQQ
jgi:hypothetical protein